MTGVPDRVAWLSPGDPDQRTGGYLWNARIAAELRALGVRVDVVAVPGEWPIPGAADGAGALLASIPDGMPVIADGLGWPGLGALGDSLAARCPVVVVVHALLGTEGPPGPESATLDAWERAAWGPVRFRVATSARTARALGPGPEIAVVTPGVAPSVARWAPRSGAGPARVLTVGTVTARKGHDRLIDAMAAGAGDWRLDVAGDPRDPAWARAMADRAADAGVADRITWLGALDDDALHCAYLAADLVVQVARFEAFGMAITEAVARGVPVLTTPAGALDHLPQGAVATVADDIDAGRLGAEIARWLGDADARADLAARASSAAPDLPSWADQAAAFATLLARLR